jgi:MOSC domain-containing protein YiiM
MKVVSVNRSVPREIIFQGKTEKTGYYKEPVASAINLTKNGVENDHVADLVHHGGIHKACYIYSLEHYDYWKPHPALSDGSFGVFGENITALGMREADTHIGDVFSIGTAEVEISQPRQPCYKMGLRFGDPEMVQRFRLGPHPGFYVRVVREGTAAAGDAIERIHHHRDALTLTEVFALLYAQHPNPEHLRRALDEPLLAPNVKQYLEKKFNRFVP